MARMKRSRRAYLNELQEQNETLRETEEFVDYEAGYEEAESEEAPSSTRGKKIITAIIVIVALVALFFASSKITELWLDYNQEPASYGNDIPDVEQDDLTDIEEEIIDVPNAPVDEIGETGEKPAETEKTEEEKPAEAAKPTQKPAENEKPAETEKPAPAPSETTKPETPKPEETKPVTPEKKPASIIPGNPAA